METGSKAFAVMPQQLKAMEQKDKNLELKEQQIQAVENDEEQPTVQANRSKDHKILVVEADGYVHVATQINHIQGDLKTFIPEERIVKIHKRDFEPKVNEGIFMQYDEAVVIHDPRKNAPKSYDLKPAIGAIAAPGAPAASGLATKERELALKERDLQLQERDLQLRERELKMQESRQAAKHSPAQTPKKEENLIGASSAASDESDLPPLGSVAVGKDQVVEDLNQFGDPLPGPDENPEPGSAAPPAKQAAKTVKPATPKKGS